MSKKPKASQPASLRKPLTAFIRYKREVYKDVIKKHPRIAKDIRIFSKKLARMWKQEKPQVKAHYKALYRKEMQVYQKELLQGESTLVSFSSAEKNSSPK